MTLDGINAGIKWDGVLQVQFSVPVAPQVFHKIVYVCQNYKAAPASNQEAGELVDDNSTVILDRDDIVKVFGEVSLMPVSIRFLQYRAYIPVIFCILCP